MARMERRPEAQLLRLVRVRTQRLHAGYFICSCAPHSLRSLQRRGAKPLRPSCAYADTDQVWLLAVEDWIAVHNTLEVPVQNTLPNTCLKTPVFSLSVLLVRGPSSALLTAVAAAATHRCSPVKDEQQSRSPHLRSEFQPAGRTAQAPQRGPAVSPEWAAQEGTGLRCRV